MGENAFEWERADHVTNMCMLSDSVYFVSTATSDDELEIETSPHLGDMTSELDHLGK